MCISLTPLKVESNIIIAKMNQVTNKVQISYSILISDVFEQEQTRSGFNNANQEDKVLGFFISENSTFEDIELVDYTSNEDKNLIKVEFEILISLISIEKNPFFSSRSVSKGNDSVEVKQNIDGSITIKSKNPESILNAIQEVRKINPNYLPALIDSSTKAIEQTKNTLASQKPCIIYLTTQSKVNGRALITYNKPLEEIIYLPTVENNHSTLQINQKVDYDNIVVIGSDQSTDEDFELTYFEDLKRNLIVPKYISIFQHFQEYDMNGYIGVKTANNQSRDNLELLSTNLDLFTILPIF
jgi:hypothetical protein